MNSVNRSGDDGRRAPSPRRRASFLGSVVTLGIGLVMVAALGLVLAVAIAMAYLPSYGDMRRSPKGQTVQVKAADGSLLTTVGPSYGRWLALEDIPPVMVDAMVAVEDRRFYRHPGIDPIGIARAMWVNAREGGSIQGGSTITQQLARNIFLTNARTYGRKAREFVLALAIEQRFSKRDILELYLNRVYFGGGAYGIDAASRRFFGHSAVMLSLPEAAVIAGLVKAPSRYAPSSDPARAKERASVVLAVMAERGVVDDLPKAQARLHQLQFAPRPRENNVRYFTDWVLTQLEELTGGGQQQVEVETTLLPGMQRAAERAIAAETPKGAQGALLAMSHDGAIRAMVGGRDYIASIYNRAVAARRQPGSSFKLFVYLAALERGYTPDDIVVDEPIRIGNWSPRNDNRRYVGPVTLRQAFAGSINTVAVRLADEAGLDTVAEMARRFGISTPIDGRPAMALGTSEVTLLDMTSAYASVARGGFEARPFGITRVTTPDGEVLYEREASAPRQLVASDVAAGMTDLLKAAVETGTGRAAQIGRPIAGKTGTTSSNKDGWFLGFTGDLAAGVWMGRDDARALPGLAGGRAPARAFATFMRGATKGMPAQPLQIDIAALEGVEPDAEYYGLSPEGGSYPGEPADGPSDPGEYAAGAGAGAEGGVGPDYSAGPGYAGPGYAGDAGNEGAPGADPFGPRPADAAGGGPLPAPAAPQPPGAAAGRGESAGGRLDQARLQRLLDEAVSAGPADPM